MKDKLLRKSPFQLTFLFVFTFVTSLMMASNSNAKMFDLSNEESYTSTSYACEVFSGTTSTSQPLVELSNGSATLLAKDNLNSVIPDGYSKVFVLTKGSQLTILATGPVPSFEVTEEGVYTIHSLVYNPDTLDLSIVQPGVTTGADVLGFLIAGGGEICASLDVEGTSFKVIEGTCSADSGTMTAVETQAELSNGSATLSATADDNAIIPEGFVQAFVLTQGSELVILDYGLEPSFEVTEENVYRIHSLVFNPNTLDLSIVQPGVTTGVDVLGFLIAGGGEICASLDVPGALFKVIEEQCTADSGTMTAVESQVELSNGSATLSATADDNAIIPEGYVQAFVLTQGSELVILDYGLEPSFEVSEAGDYTIHSLVFNPDTLDLSIVQPGVTTGVDVLGFLIAGGGEICASLDVPGAPIKVDEEQCTADSGTMTAVESQVELSNGSATLLATADDNAIIPEGYVQAFVLTQGSELVILDYGLEPSFEVSEAGDYTIHSLVFNPDTLDLSIVQPGVTTGVDVLGFLIAGGGEICASLDVPGAPIKVDEEQCTADSGTMTAVESQVELSNGSATLSATADDNAIIPEGYVQAFVLTQGSELVILDYGLEPSFEVSEAGDYTIHSLVFNPDTLDLSIVQPGVTTGVDVLGFLIAGGGEICASLDVPGAPIKVDEEQCTADSGTMTAVESQVELSNGSATLSATADDNAIIPEGYVQAFVLTQGSELVILDYGLEPSFEVSEAGDYTIHSLVFNPDTLDLSIVQPGVTTGVDVLGFLIAGGGEICASLDVPGAPIKVDEEQCTADSGTMTAVESQVELSNGSATLSATADDNAIIPEGYVQAFVLTQGSELVILDYGLEPSFEVSEAGDYTIHSLVFNPDTLDLSIVQPGVTTGVDVLGFLIAGGGEICASLDVPGAPIKVDEEQCTADSGTMNSSHPISCINGQGYAEISAMQNEAAVIPAGYDQLFVLTSAFNLVILDASATPEFTINHPGFYRIHSLVYNPDTLDLGVVQFGTTTGFDVLHLIEQNNICASLDVHGALNLVLPKWICHFFNNSNYRIDPNALVENYLNDFDSYEAFEASMAREKLDVKVYPNPVANDLFIKTEIIEDEQLSYTIIDVSGRIMATGSTTSAMGNKDISINTSILNEGTYFVKFDSKYRSFTKAIQVSK